MRCVVRHEQVTKIAHPSARAVRGDRSGYKVWLKTLQCTGIEAHISRCRTYGWEPSYCTTNSAAAVNCGGSGTPATPSPPAVPAPTPAPPPTVGTRIEITLETNGRLLVRLGTQGEGTICSDGFDVNDARVICRMFNLPHSTAQAQTFHQGTNNRKVWISDIQCNGTEYSLYGCRYRGFGITNCRSSGYAGVVCGSIQIDKGGSCGTQQTPKIFGAEEVARGTWPWIASLQYRNRQDQHFCGAVVVDTEWLVTAAHCVYSESAQNNLSIIQVEVGTNDLRAGSQPYRISQIVIHPGYNNVQLIGSNDIALLRLSQRLTYSPIIQPVCLVPDRNVNFNALCFIAGWGRTRQGGPTSTELFAANVSLVADSFCKSYFSSYVDDLMLCAGGERDACKGDSGGPLMCRRQDTNIYDLYGIVSAGQPCGFGNNGNYGIYVDISRYTSWIRSSINNVQDRTCPDVPAISNGGPNSTATRAPLNTVISYRCTAGYSLSHSNPLRCIILASGQPGWNPSPPTCTASCGSFGSKIYGGITASINSWPWIAQLRIRVGINSTNITVCAGTIIDRKWILTGADCLYAFQGRRPYIEVIVGVKNRTSSQRVSTYATWFLVHTSYQPGAFSYQIALVQLGAPLIYTRYIQPMCLNSVRNRIPTGPCYIAGWGSLGEGTQWPIQNLQSANYPIVSDSLCSRYDVLRGPLNGTHLCAGYADGRTTPCLGDVGSPLICRRSYNVYEQWGIVAGIIRGGCGTSFGSYTLWTEVAAYTTWIRSTMSQFP